jgi:hypothetical protein
VSPVVVLRLLARVLAGVVLAAAGLYVVVYLWRWEWQRAIIAGVFFLSALVVVSTLVLLAAVRRLGSRLEEAEAERRRAEARAARALRRASTERAGRHFEWLREPPDRLGVFVPVLLGAGALLSGLAYLNERLAGAVASSTVDRTTVRLLAPDLPLGPTPPAPPPVRSSERTGTAAALATVAAVAVAVTGIVVVLMALTQNRADLPSGAGTTTLELSLVQRRPARPAMEVGTALAVACRSRLSGGTDLAALASGGTDRVTLVVDHPLGEFTRRRLVGCLEDATLDRVQATVVTLRSGT